MIFKDLVSFEQFLLTRKDLGIKPGLRRMEKMAEALGHPERNNKFIHVAGTNGKGSTIAFIKQALIENNYQVGVFSSPSFHGILGYFEKNNGFVEAETLLSQANIIYPVIKALDLAGDGPTEFEIITMLAFLVFQRSVDFVLLETGMGGREDTTNIVNPIVSVITNVTYDHQQFLGQKIEEIAAHKAGIIKKQCPVVVGDLSDHAAEVIRREVKENKSRHYQYGDDFGIKDNVYFNQTMNHIFPLKLKLKGRHQYHNASLAMTVLKLLENKGYHISWDKGVQAINQAFMPGRFETLEKYPWLTLDSAHNSDAVKAFIDTVRSFETPQKKTLIFASFQDKAFDVMLKQLTLAFDQVYLTTFDHPRAAKYDVLKPFLKSDHVFWLEDWQVKMVEIALTPAKQRSYFVTGSLDFITKVRKYLLKH